MTDREIIESLAEIKQGHKVLEQRFDGVDQRFDGVDNSFKTVDQHTNDLRTDMNKRFEGVDQRVNDLRTDMNNRFEDVNQRLDRLHRTMLTLLWYLNYPDRRSVWLYRLGSPDHDETHPGKVILPRTGASAHRTKPGREQFPNTKYHRNDALTGAKR